MLSRLRCTMPLVEPAKPIFSSINYHKLVNKQPIRCSGHNTMLIEPSNYTWKYFKNMLHFYTLIAAIPITVISTIIGIRMNPELTEIPEGYEPRHWEYYKHPISRWLARYIYNPMELEHEMRLACLDHVSETRITQKIEETVDKVMRFHSDSRNRYFAPYYGEYSRIARDQLSETKTSVLSNENIYLEAAYDPKFNPVPTEGYKPLGPLE